MDEILGLVGTAAGPSTVVGLCLTVLFYLRKQEAGIRADINGSLARLTAENEDKDLEIETLHTQLDALREAKWKALEESAKQKLRADLAEARLIKETSDGS